MAGGIHRKPNKKQKNIVNKTKVLKLQIENNEIDIKHLENDVDILEKQRLKAKSVCSRHENGGSLESVGGTTQAAADRSNQLPDEMIRQLEKHADDISSEIWNYKNRNQTLRKEILCAKKVMRREVGGDSVSFETLQRVTLRSPDWKGRRETALHLKERIRDLRGHLDGGQQPLQQQPRRLRRAAACSPERRRYWRLELERRQVLEKADRDLTSLEQERKELRRRLQGKHADNVSMAEKVKALREEICILVDKNNSDSDLIRTLQSVEIQLKDSLDKRWELQRHLESMRSNNSRITTTTEALREHTAILQGNLEQDALLLSTLEDQEYRLNEILDVEKMRNHQEAEQGRRALGEVADAYEAAGRSLAALEARLARGRERIVDAMPTALKEELWPPEESNAAITEETADGDASEATTQRSPDTSEGFEPGPGDDADPDSPEAERDRSRTLAEAAAAETRRMTALVFVIVETLQERTEQAAAEERALIGVREEGRLLREEVARLRKAPPPPRKEEGAALRQKLSVRLDILNKENTFLIGALNALLANQANDFELCKAFTENNKEIFGNTITALTELA